jgi:hypothetical protein
MRKILDLKFLFTVIAVVEALYALIGILTPPSMVTAVTGWVLTADGLWIAKLVSMALASQAWVAWILRKQPHLGVANALAFYQVGSATVDWAMWLALADQGIFSTAAGRVSVIVSIPLHYTLGILLFAATWASRTHASLPELSAARAPT